MIVKGIVHCHSDLSFDSTLSLDDLCATLSQEGLHFVALTEHTRGVTPSEYQKYVEACRHHSSPSFVVVPGLEVRCERGIEMAGVGLYDFVADGPVEQVVSSIQERGAYALWVHPRKRGVASTTSLSCDAWEVLNGKLDGTIAPSINVLKRLRAFSKGNDRPHAIFGLDLHSLTQNRSAWLECDVPALSCDAIVTALREGRFHNRTATIVLPSSGRMSCWNYLLVATMRTAYISWNRLLTAVPPSARAVLLSISRRGVAWFHRGA